jgi:hypothetical protein
MNVRTAAKLALSEAEGAVRRAQLDTFMWRGHSLPANSSHSNKLTQQKSPAAAEPTIQKLIDLFKAYY